MSHYFIIQGTRSEKKQIQKKKERDNPLTLSSISPPPPPLPPLLLFCYSLLSGKKFHSTSDSMYIAPVAIKKLV